MPLSSDKRKAVLAHGDHTAKQQQEILNYIEQERSHQVYIEDKLIDPTNSEKQLGRTLLSSEMERKLATVLPSSIAFIDNPYVPTKRAVVRLLSHTDVLFGTYETICPYEKGVMPEHSVLQLNEVETPDPDIISRRKILKRSDLGQSEYIPGEGFVSTTRPGFVKTKQLGREITRGWRTVLIKLMLSGYLSVVDAERLFGADSTTQWAKHTGRKDYIDVPW